MRDTYENLFLLRTIKRFVKEKGYNAMEATRAVGEAVGLDSKERQNLWNQYTSMPPEFFTESE